MISVRDLVVRFDEVVAVDGVSFDVTGGELFVLLGSSGCGKTTTLRAVGGFERAARGTVSIGGACVCGEGAWIPPEKRGAGFVFQDYALFPHLTVAENVGFGIRDRGERARRVAELLDLVDLAGCADRRPHTLSGGQQQRVALARAVAPRPRVVLLDEPFGNLDAALRDTVRRRALGFLRDEGVTMLLVTHDQHEALAVADRVAVMRHGRVAQMGPPEALYARPESAFVASFLGRTNLLPATAAGDTATTVVGEVELARPAEGPVTVSLRPHDVALTPGGSGVVTARAFLGHSVRLDVALGGVALEVLAPADTPYRPGDAVTASAAAPAVAVETESDT